MTKKKEQHVAFESIRVIGKKAQDMISHARTTLAREEKHIEKLPPKAQKDFAVVHLSTKSVAQATCAIIGILIGLWLLFHLRHRIMLLLLAVFVATVIDPGVQAMRRWGIPRGVAVILHYIFALALIIFLIVSFIPIIATQIQDIARNISDELAPFMASPQIDIPLLSPEANAQLSRLAETMLQNLSLDRFVLNLQQTGQQLSDVAQESVRFAARIAGSVVNFVVSFIVVLVLAFFMQLEKERMISWLRGFLPPKYRAYAEVKSEAIHTKIGQWMRGELLLMFSIFLLTFIALSILGIDYALTLAVLAGFCELIPAVGPIIASIPAILIGGTQEGLLWIPIIGGVYYAIQWVENNLLVPLIMKRAVGLSPIAILFAMLVGISFPNTIHPILGVMLSVPVTTILTLFLEDWRAARSRE
ncbi:MAG: AI-2E family transporter [Candidatus Peribacteraceae bacterium]|nr:AI-2E family transporter [Candidatus Peribacteraceae bacterium]